MGHGSSAGAAAAPASSHDHAHASAWPEGGPHRLLALRVRERVRYERKLPSTLARIAPIDVAGARERPFRFGYNKGRWRINDRVFVMGETPVEVARDTTEVWLLRNYHTSMPHAMHLHGFHFEVLERETSPDFVAALAVDERARLPSDLGRKDTLLVWPGESVRVAIRFALPWPAAQTYMFHCHNLEHEDGGMMVGVRVA
jgi:suppressor of ftsI/bilirubin oxidase